MILLEKKVFAQRKRYKGAGTTRKCIPRAVPLVTELAQLLRFTERKRKYVQYKKAAN
jgi:hypothetical protein